MKQLEFDNIIEDTIKMDDGSTLLVKDMETVMQDSMMPYAEYVIMDRAIPRVEDGLKPVQRRILYAMLDLGITPDKPYKKSARIVGECLGKYHPHGDSSVYNAMVRMAQPFNMNSPLVEGQGNFGSIDGDGAAAMRYTEARLSELAMELLKDIDKNTVKWSRNFDDSTKEPDMLPGRFPNLLVNGASGIAVGLATNIPPHNLSEVINGVVAYIDNNKVSLQTMMKYISGPDFPSGGYCIGGEGLVQAYETGKGRILLRAKCSIERQDNGREQIVITELPYQVNKSQLLIDIMKLREDRKEQLAGIAEIVDESDKDGIRAVIKIKKDFDSEKILALLFKYTNLQISFSINMVAIADGKPQLMGLLDIIAYYTNYQRSVVLFRTKFELEEARARMHILEGLVIAVTNIDEVIKIIKSAASTTDAKQKLRVRFDLSDKQAQAILDLRLARLTKLEITKLMQELEDLRRLVDRLESIVRSPKLLMEVVKEELIAIKKAYKADRKSTIIDSEDYAVVDIISNEIAEESTVVCVTTEGLIKRCGTKNYALSNKDLNDINGLPLLTREVIATNTTRRLMFFTSMGNCYRIEAGRIPDGKYKDDAINISAVFQLQQDEKVIKVFELPVDGVPDGELLFYTKLGLIKRSKWEEYALLKTGFVGYKGKDDDEVIKIEQLDNNKPNILYVTKDGMCINFALSEVPLQGRVAGGVKGMMLSDNDYVVFCGQVDDTSQVAIVTDKGFAKKVAVNEITPITRYRKGVKICDMTTSNGKSVLHATLADGTNYMVLVDSVGVLTLNTDDIALESRTSRGKLCKGKKKNSQINFVIGYTNAVQK
ncbi:MAG: DNA topoisomerase 4 subunit A [Clostridia bacterium]|nr:DNA topoisomerase 4 subunit A [Clostridia bacterium]